MARFSLVAITLFIASLAFAQPGGGGPGNPQAPVYTISGSRFECPTVNLSTLFAMSKSGGVCSLTGSTSGDVLTQYLKLAGRSGTANDPILSTSGTGTLTGSSAALSGLVLKASTSTGNTVSIVGGGFNATSDSATPAAFSLLLPGANGVGLQPPSGMSTYTLYNLPATFPSVSGQVMSSTTGGTMSWRDDTTCANQPNLVCLAGRTGTTNDFTLSTSVDGTITGSTTTGKDLHLKPNAVDGTDCQIGIGALICSNSTGDYSIEAGPPGANSLGAASFYANGGTSGLAQYVMSENGSNKGSLQWLGGSNQLVMNYNGSMKFARVGGGDLKLPTANPTANGQVLTATTAGVGSWGNPNALTSAAADPADAGVVRLGNAENICWEANPTGTDLCINETSNNRLSLPANDTQQTIATAGSGNVDVSFGSANLTGHSTLFNTELAVGDVITISGQDCRISGITNDTTATIIGTWPSASLTGQSYTIQKPSSYRYNNNGDMVAQWNADGSLYMGFLPTASTTAMLTILPVSTTPWGSTRRGLYVNGSSGTSLAGQNGNPGGGGAIILGGNGGAVLTGSTGKNGGTGGSTTITTGSGGGVTATDTSANNVGGTGGLLTLTSGPGGNVTAGSSDTGGAGGSIIIGAGNGGSADVGNIKGTGGNVSINAGAIGTGGGSGGAIGIVKIAQSVNGFTYVGTAGLRVGDNTNPALTNSFEVLGNSLIDNNSTANSIKLREDSGNGSDYIALKAPASVTNSASKTFIFPDTITNDQFLKCTVSGNTCTLSTAVPSGSSSFQTHVLLDDDASPPDYAWITLGDLAAPASVATNGTSPAQAISIAGTTGGATSGTTGQLAANGATLFLNGGAGGSANSATGTGLLQSSSSVNVVGNASTLFTTECPVGTFIAFGTDAGRQWRTVATVTDNTHLTTDTAFNPVASNSAYVCAARNGQGGGIVLQPGIAGQGTGFPGMDASGTHQTQSGGTVFIAPAGGRLYMGPPTQQSLPTATISSTGTAVTCSAPCTSGVLAVQSWFVAAGQMREVVAIADTSHFTIDRAFSSDLSSAVWYPLHDADAMFQVVGWNPPAVTTGNGWTAPQAFSVTGGTGGSTSSATGTGGGGGSMIFLNGSGGAATTSGGTGGTGGTVNLLAGSGGAGTVAGANGGAGAQVLLWAGSGGAAGSGATNGTGGNVSIEGGGAGTGGTGGAVGTINIGTIRGNPVVMGRNLTTGVAGTAQVTTIGQGTTSTDTSTLRIRSGNSGTTASSLVLARNTTDVSQLTTDGTNTYLDYASGGVLQFRSGIAGATVTSVPAIAGTLGLKPIHSMAWFFPGTPATGQQAPRALVPEGVTGCTILNSRISVGTAAASGSPGYNIARCTTSAGNCTATANIYASPITTLGTNQSVAGGAPGTATITAGDAFKVDITNVGTTIADITVTMAYTCDQ